MTKQRAQTILRALSNDQRIEDANVACLIGVEAIGYRIEYKIETNFAGTCKCGKTVIYGKKFCPNCGQKLDWR